ncbi:formimidoylglutamase [Tenuibacillus multivorans]|uniref:Formimidoylglutamase n=1 Tax=Tenuibacillus multivorans TaxID=237069 RepID=A0A1G9WVB2_9BACI|nr:formimidoylglutamase [Tenuibacillus multivorans]SDM88211.1 formiminoglutamase [Tenuibacillus multivorans]
MSNFLKPAGEAKFVDRHTTKFNELLVPDKKHTGPVKYGVLGAPLSKPSISHSGASFAPGAIRQAMASYSTYANHSGHDFRDQSIVDFGDVVMQQTDILESQDRIYKSIDHVLAKQEVENLIVFGGDHSVSFPSIKAHQKHKGTIGVIQFDAHHDLRNLEDGGPTNGTPFRRSIENQVLKGEHIVQIGIRDFTNAKAYADYAKDQGVQVYTMQDVYRQNIEDIIQQSLVYLKDKVDLIYLSVDMDVLDQAFAPGCPAIGPGGMDSWTLLTAVEEAAKHEMVQGMDIVEIDPTIDIRNMTSRVASHVLFSYLKGKELSQ